MLERLLEDVSPAEYVLATKVIDNLTKEISPDLINTFYAGANSDIVEFLSILDRESGASKGSVVYELHELEQEVKQLQSEVYDLDYELEAAEDTIVDLDIDNDHLAADVKELEDEVKELENEVEELYLEVASLKEENERLEAEIEG